MNHVLFSEDILVNQKQLPSWSLYSRDDKETDNDKHKHIHDSLH